MSEFIDLMKNGKKEEKKEEKKDGKKDDKKEEKIKFFTKISKK